MKNTRWISLALACFMSVSTVSFLSACTDKGTVFSVDFSQKDGSLPQNLKKIDMFNPTWTFMGEADGTFDPSALNTLNGIQQLKPDHFRIDMMFGNEQNGIGKPIGRNGQSGLSDDEWSLAREFIDCCQENGVTPYLVMVGTPSYATKDGDDVDFRNVPDLDRYYEFCYNAADYLKRNDIYAVLETWNEPDLEGNTYWLGSAQEWIDTVVTGAGAYYDANIFSTVISPGIARPLQFIQEKEIFNGEEMTGWDYFWESSAENDALPDGFSWHFYGPSDGDLEGDYINEGGTGNFNYQLNELRGAFNKTSQTMDLRKVQMHLTEFHPVSNDFFGGKSQMNDTYEQVWAFYDSILRINEASDVTRVSWPMWLSTDQFGLFEEYLAVNPVYHVLWTYGRLPVDRIHVVNDSEKVGILSGADSQRAGIIVYNRSLNERQQVTINWSSLPFEADECTIYRIDPEYYTQRLPEKMPEIYKTINRVKERGSETLDIAVKGAYYIEFNTSATMSELDKTVNVGKLLKKEYYYAERGDNLPYADIFNQSMNAYVGMAGEEEGEAGVAVILGEMNKNPSLTFRYETWGELAAGESSSLGVRVDYHTAEGFSNAVYISLEGFEYNMLAPFGTGRVAEQSLLFDDSNKCTLDLKQYAPKNWDGVVEISYLIRNAGAGSTAKFFVE